MQNTDPVSHCSLEEKTEAVESLLPAGGPIDDFLDRDTLAEVLSFIPSGALAILNQHAPAASLFADSNRAHRNRIESQQKDSAWCQIFLTHIDRGREEAVSEMMCSLLDPESAHFNPKRLLRLMKQKSCYHSPAGLIFEGVTGLQLAAWNQDALMRHRISACLDGLDCNEAPHQLSELAEKGLNYRIPWMDFQRLKSIIDIEPDCVRTIDKLPSGEYWVRVGLLSESKEEPDDYVTLNEKGYHWGFRVLQAALKNFIHAMVTMSQTGKYNIDWLEYLWMDVGYAQRYLTIPFINAYCANMAFHPLPNFRTVTIPRVTTYASMRTNEMDEWFDNISKSARGAGLGVSFGVFKSGMLCRMGIFSGGTIRIRFGTDETSNLSAAVDLAALNALYQVRVAENALPCEEARTVVSRRR